VILIWPIGATSLALFKRHPLRLSQSQNISSESPKANDLIIARVRWCKKCTLAAAKCHLWYAKQLGHCIGRYVPNLSCSPEGAKVVLFW
jgi:hypothetical protein